MSMTVDERPEKKKRHILRKVLLVVGTVFALAAVFVGTMVLTLPDVSGLKSANPSSTSLIRLRQIDAEAKGRPLRVRMEWVAFGRVPHLLKESVRVTEDYSFYWHKGIDYFKKPQKIWRSH
jgi:membrane peptidoglycan carboxypeptidase